MVKNRSDSHENGKGRVLENEKCQEMSAQHKTKPNEEKNKGILKGSRFGGHEKGNRWGTS